MEFTFDAVVEAISIATSPNTSGANQDQTRKQEALDYLQEWTHSEDGSILAMQILSDDNLSQTHKIYATSLIKMQIPFFWGKLSDEDRSNLKQQFFNFFETTQLENGDTLLEMIIDILVNIALYEFPEDWPDLQNIVFSDISQNEDLLVKSHCYHFVAQFISAVDKSANIISSKRTQYLRNLFLDNCDILYTDITSCFEVENFVSDGLKIFNAFLQWANSEQVNGSVNLFHTLCYEFIFDERIRKETLNCLTTVFTTRLDSTTFVTISPLIISKLCSPNCVLENQQHITSDQEVLNFLLRILTRFLPHLLTVFDPTNDSSRTESIRSTMAEYSLDPNELKNSIIFILGVIVSIRTNDLLSEEYWTFWITIFHNMLSEKKKGGDSYKPISEFMNGLLPDIREAIYNCVPLDHIEDADQESGSNDQSAPYVPQQSVFCTNRSRSAWSLIALIDPDGTLAFMKEQEPSIAQCYAIGNLEFCNQEQFDVSLLSSELTELYNSTETRDPDPAFFVALLFCFSHTLTFDTGGQFFINFVEFATKCVKEENPPISTAATNALLYAMRKVKSGFLTENYVQSICDSAEDYLMKLDHDDAVRMFNIASTLACTMSTEEQITDLYSKLAEPLSQAMEAEFQLEKIFDCIKETSNKADTSSRIFMNFLWKQLLSMADKIIHSNPPVEILESCLDAVSTGIRNEAYNEESIILILTAMSEKTQSNIELGHQIDDSFYKFIGCIRSRFSEINAMLPDIISMFIEPAAPKDLASLSSIMWMLSEFTFQIYDFEWYIQLAIKSITSFDKQDNRNGLQCTKKLISRTNQESFSEAIKNGSLPSILTAVFASLTDAMHKESIQFLIEFIKAIILKGSEYNLTSNEAFGQMFLNAISENVQEPQPDMFSDFISTLFTNINRPYNFSKTVSEFLIYIRKISPNDVDAFKVNKESSKLTGGRGKIIRIEPDGQTKEINISDQKHFRIIDKPNGF